MSSADAAKEYIEKQQVELDKLYKWQLKEK
jgi:hypothetical protein